MKESLITKLALLEIALFAVLGIVIGVIGDKTLIITVIIDTVIHVIFYFCLLSKSINNNVKKVYVGVLTIIFCSVVGGILYLVWMKKGSIAEEEELAHRKGGEIGHQKVGAYCPYCGAPLVEDKKCSACGKEL